MQKRDHNIVYSRSRDLSCTPYTFIYQNTYEIELLWKRLIFFILFHPILHNEQDVFGQWFVLMHLALCVFHDLFENNLTTSGSVDANNLWRLIYL